MASNIFYVPRLSVVCFQALDLWMAGCMVFVFAALAEFVVVKVLDVQYQQQIKQTPKPILPLRLTSTMEKGQCQTVAVFDGHGTNVRSRKANTQTPTTPVPVSGWLESKFYRWIIYCLFAAEHAGQWRFARPQANQPETVDSIGFVDRQRHRRREDYVAGDRQALPGRLSRAFPRLCDPLLANTNFENEFLAKSRHVCVRQHNRNTRRRGRLILDERC